MSYPIDPIASGLYALRAPRQTVGFSFQVSLYGTDPTVTWDATQGSPSGREILLYENVPCSIQMTANTAAPSAIGLTAGEYLQVLDKAHFHLLQPIQSGWYLKITAVGASGVGMLGQWRAVMGPPQDMGFRAATRKVLCKTVSKPAWAT